MELQSPLTNSARAKRLWKVLKIIFSVIRKGLISKAKLLMDLNLNLMVKRGHSKLSRKCLEGNFASRGSRVGSFGVLEYEFSCTNSPNPIFFRSSPKKKQVFFFLSCLRFPESFDEAFESYDLKKVVHVPNTPEYLSNYHLDASFNQAPYDCNSSLLLSPCAVRVSDYLSAEMDDVGDGRVDHDAEEFIRRFYEQLRVQSPISLHS